MKTFLSRPACRLSAYWFSLGFLVSLASFTGCSEDSAGNREEVNGKVTFKGQPLASGTIQFSAVAPATGFAGGLISNGEYKVPAEFGLDPGSYEVRISSGDSKEVDTSVPPGESGPPAKELIPA